MTRDTLRDSIPLGILIGVVVAIVGWWTVFTLSAVMGDASGTLGEPEYPSVPRVLIVAVAAGSVALLLTFRSAAITAAVLALASVAYSLLVTAGLTAHPVGLTESWGVSAAPGLAYQVAGARGAVQDLLHAFGSAGTHVPLLLAAGAWTAVAAWWVMPRQRTQPAWEPVRRRPAGWIGVLAGIGLVLVGWWLLPVIGRALTLTLVDGREAFSILPSLAAFSLAALSCWPMLRWPRLGQGAGLTALLLLGISLLVADPASSAIRSGSETWSITTDDLVRAVAGGAFAPRTLVLGAIWMAIALARWRWVAAPSVAPLGVPRNVA